MTQQEVAAWLASQHPEPAAILAELGPDGRPTGRTWAQYASTNGAPIRVLNSASPRRPWAVQRTDATARMARDGAEIGRLRDVRLAVLAARDEADASIVRATNALAIAQSIDPTAWAAGAQRTQMQAVKAGMIEGARASRDSAQATRKALQGILDLRRALLALATGQASED
jgi:hypothetical protein